MLKYLVPNNTDIMTYLKNITNVMTNNKAIIY